MPLFAAPRAGDGVVIAVLLANFPREKLAVVFVDFLPVLLLADFVAVAEEMAVPAALVILHGAGILFKTTR